MLALGAFALPAAAAAGILEEPEKAKLITTGNSSELREKLPITKTPGAGEKVAMSLGPEDLPRFETGDRLRVNAEVQLSTTCLARGRRCVGKRYGYNPRFYGRLVLAAAPEPGAAELWLGEQRAVRCNQKRPNRNHHCTLAFPAFETTIGDLAALPCPANACYVNLLMGAHNRRARPGNKMVLGGDRPDGSVVQDKGRLNVIHSRVDVAPPTEASSSFLINPDLPLTEGKKEKRRVVFTVEIPPAEKGELLEVDGSWVADIERLPFNTFLASRLIVADSPIATESGPIAKASTILRGQASEANGFNCTQGPSGYRTPCEVQKAGAIRIRNTPVDPATGGPAPLYLNLVASAKALLTPRVKRSQRVVLGSGGGLTVRRFKP